MEREEIKQKVLTRLHATHLSFIKHPNSKRFGGMGPMLIKDLAEIYSLEEEDIKMICKELEADSLVDFVSWDKSQVSISGLGLQRLDLMEQLKSKSYHALLQTILETNMQTADPKDKIGWKKRIADTVEAVITKTGEVLVTSAIKSQF